MAASQFFTVRRNPGCQSGFIAADQQLQFPFFGLGISERVNFFKLSTGINVNDGKRDLSEKGFARDPEHGGRVFTDRPKKGCRLEAGESFPDKINGFVF